MIRPDQEPYRWNEDRLSGIWDEGIMRRICSANFYQRRRTQCLLDFSAELPSQLSP
jgi:hypothetical protein